MSASLLLAFWATLRLPLIVMMINFAQSVLPALLALNIHIYTPSSRCST